MIPDYSNFIKLAIARLPKTREDLLHLKKKISKELKISIPTNADLRETYEELVKSKEIVRHTRLEELLLTRRVRSESGVAVVAVLTKPYPCPGKCLYCPTEKEMPKSYLSNEPAVMRAIDAKFNPYKQVQTRLRALELNGHKLDKIELIVMGGTFSYLPKAYQKKFITECFRACNDYGHVTHNRKHLTRNRRDAINRVSTLTYEQKKNEKSKVKIVGLTLETRPDYINQKEIINFRELGCTRVELGVQSVFDDVLNFNKRGHLVKETIEATKILKDAGFKINYHIMPGLPGSDLKKDYKMFQELFSNPDFQPDMLKIYPTVLVKDSELYSLWSAGKYQALTDKDFEKFILKVKKNIIPPTVRISRLIRDVPTTSILAGPIVNNLRQIIAPQSQCQCIRCREVRSDYKSTEKIILDRIDYAASGGKEIFLQYVSANKKKLFALLRLRISTFPSPKGLALGYPKAKPLGVFSNTALIRELHTYGKLTEINKSDKKSPQHIGLGKKLILEAERIAKKEFGLNKIAVISGVGVRGYYRKLGYRLVATYMVKSL